MTDGAPDDQLVVQLERLVIEAEGDNLFLIEGADEHYLAVEPPAPDVEFVEVIEQGEPGRDADDLTEDLLLIYRTAKL